MIAWETHPSFYVLSSKHFSNQQGYKIYTGSFVFLLQLINLSSNSDINSDIISEIDRPP